MLFFALNGSDGLGQRIAGAGGFDLAPHEERDFAGGEHKARPLTSVRGKDVYVLHGLQGKPGMSANDRLIRLLLFLATCRENGAARVTAIVPYLAYSRKDRQTKPRDPVTTRYVAKLFEAAGTDMVITLDVHNIMAFQNAFRCGSLNLETRGLFAADIAARKGPLPLAVISPDGGGIKRAELFREMLAETTGRNVSFGFMEKRRSAGVVTGSLFAGEVEGCAVHIVDDMIVGGGTVRRAAEAVRERGAAEVHAVATHGLLEPGAAGSLGRQGLLDSITLTDSAAPLPVNAEGFGCRVRVLGCAGLIAGAMRALHSGTPLAELPMPVPQEVSFG